jgi:hypothetical protein
MFERRRGAGSGGWAAQLRIDLRNHERALGGATGEPVRLSCDDRNDELVVDLRGLQPAHMPVIMDTLAPLWPGFLAPSGVALVVVDGDVWDHETMALRCHEMHGSA